MAAVRLDFPPCRPLGFLTSLDGGHANFDLFFPSKARPKIQTDLFYNFSGPSSEIFSASAGNFYYSN
jgi:hypothetical protein